MRESLIRKDAATWRVRTLLVDLTAECARFRWGALREALRFIDSDGLSRALTYDAAPGDEPLRECAARARPVPAPTLKGDPMTPKTSPGDIRWWFWLLTLAFIVAALAGWNWAYDVVIAISALQVVFFVVQDRSLATMAVQVRIVYFLFTLFAFSASLRVPIYLLLLVGTFMVTFFDRCAIALVLKKMPWNQGREMRMS